MRCLKIFFTFLLVIVGVFILGFSPCGAEKIELVLWSGYPEMLPFYEKMARAYEQDHPNVKIEAAAFELREFERKLAATIPSGTESDIIEISVYALRRFIEAGYVPKNPPGIVQYVNSKSILPIHRENITYRGDTYGVPFFQGRQVMFWNKAMFREAGLTRAPENWAEVIEFSQKVAKRDPAGELTRSGISLRLSGAGSGVAEKWWFWVYPAGGTIIEKTPTGKYKNGYNNEAGRDALKLYIDLLYKNKVDDHKIKHDAEAFALEKTAMFTRESWVIGYMRKHAPKVEYDAALLPKYRRAGTITNIVNLHVSGSCKNPEVAWDFIIYMQKPEHLQMLLDMVGWFPCREDVDFEPIFKKVPQYRAFLVRPKGYELYMYEPIGPGDEIMTKLAERLIKAYTDRGLLDNEKGIAKVIADAAKETDEILKEAGLYGEK